MIRLHRNLLAGAAALAMAQAGTAHAAADCDPSMNELMDNGRPKWTQGVDELTWYNAGDLRYDPAIVEGALAFEKRYGIHVDLVGIPEADFVTKAARSLATGDKTYDNFDMYTAFPMPTWAERGWVAPVDCAVPEWLSDQWPEAVWDAAEYEGKHYFVPHVVQPFIFLWNKQMFEEAGLDPDEPPQGWDELISYAKQLTQDKDGDGNIDQWGFVFPMGKIERVPILSYSYFLGMNGQELWNADGSPGFDGQAGVEAMQFITDLVNEHNVTPKSVINYDTAGAADIFRSGGAAMTMHFMGHPVVEEIKQLGKENVGAAPPPASSADTEATYPLGFVGPGQYVNANSDHPLAAAHLAAFMGTYEQSWREALFETNVGANLGIWDSDWLNERYPYGDVIRGILQDGYVPTHGGLLQAMTVFKEGTSAAITQSRSPEEAVRMIVDQLKARDVID